MIGLANELLVAAIIALLGLICFHGHLRHWSGRPLYSVDSLPGLRGFVWIGYAICSGFRALFDSDPRRSPLTGPGGERGGALGPGQFEDLSCFGA